MRLPHDEQVLEKTKDDVRAFWDANPCGLKFTPDEIGTQAFFEAVEAFRYEAEGHILDFLPLDQVAGKRVLEIGCGMGTDGSQWAQHGATYVGMDLTPTAVRLTKKRFQMFDLPGAMLEGDAENLPYVDNTFDFVYSHGVLHHTPDTQRTFDEVHRVLKPGGQAIIMLYHKNSWNYWGNIYLLRRLGTALLALPGGPKLVSRLTGERVERLSEHRENLKKQGLKYLKMETFLSQNTDGPGNPIAKVYTRKQVGHLFGKFTNVNTRVAFLNRRWLPLIGSMLSPAMEKKLASRIGWHLWIFVTK